MAFRKTFVLSDESINTYGFWVRTDGIRLDAAKKNCPAYFNHRTWEVPLGHWENLRVDKESRLLGDLVIEGGNELERDYIRKIENGDIKAASIGIDVLTWSDEPANLKLGQTSSAAWDCELFEASIAPLPGNKNALALKTADGFITLSSDNSGRLLPQIKNTENMKQIALKLGLGENASEAEILMAIQKIQLKAANSEAMQKHIEDEAADAFENDDQKNLFTELSKNDFPNALRFLKLNKKPAEQPAAATQEKEPAKTLKVSDLVQKGKASLSKQGGDDDAKNCFDYLQKHDTAELARIRKDEPERYAELAKQYKDGKRYKA